MTEYDIDADIARMLEQRRTRRVLGYSYYDGRTGRPATNMVGESPMTGAERQRRTRERQARP